MCVIQSPYAQVYLSHNPTILWPSRCGEGSVCTTDELNTLNLAVQTCVNLNYVTSSEVFWAHAELETPIKWI